jgi:hypothetical protein
LQQQQQQGTSSSSVAPATALTALHQQQQAGRLLLQAGRCPAPHLEVLKGRQAEFEKFKQAMGVFVDVKAAAAAAAWQQQAARS